MAEKELIYKELSYQLAGCFYTVYNELGPAHKEQVYHEALGICFDDEKIQYRSKPRISVRFRGREVGTYEPDYVIENKIVVEIKSVLTILKVFEKQLYYYLKGTDYRPGYLVNFGGDKIDIRRRIYDSIRANSR